MNSYGTHNNAGHGQQQHHFSAQYSHYGANGAHFSGHQQQTHYDNSQHQSLNPNQYYHGQSWQQPQASWTGQQPQSNFQPPPSSYSTTGDHGYQNPYPQRPNANSHNSNQRSRHSAPSASQSCYNCGGADHWAQNCPEPRRANPAGATNDHRPPKRQRTNGPVITRYPPPPNYQRGPQRGYTHPPGGQPQGNQYSKQPALQTPVSANSYGPNQWQQQSPAHQSPQSQQSMPGTPWAQAGVQTPLSQSASPSSTPGASHQNSFSPNTASQSSHGPEFKRNSFDASRQLSCHNPHASEHENGASPQRKGDPDGPFFAVGHLEPWMEELQSLDIPDKQSNSSTIVWHPPNPVAQPLPSTASEADAIGRLPIAAKLPPGMPVSKYFQNKLAENIAQPIQDTSDWRDVMLDPAFSVIGSEGPAVPISELISRRNALAERLEDEVDHNDDNSNHPQEPAPRQSDYHTHLATEETQSRGESSQNVDDELLGRHMTDAERRAREQEVKLAALGVTGQSKPVRGPSSRPRVVSQHSDLDVNPQPRDPSPDMIKSGHHPKPFEGNESQRHVDDHSTRQPPQQRKTSKEKHTYTEAQAALQGFPTEDSDDSQSTAPSPGDYSAAQNATAPLLDGQAEDSILETQDTNGEKPNGHLERQDTAHSSDSKEKSTSPLNSRLTPEESRKRSFREVSEESNGGQKRQLDDTSRRLKKRQPQVAEAYGRRW